MTDKKRLMYIITYITLLISFFVSILCIPNRSFFSEEPEVLYRIETPDDKMIEVIKVMGGATSLDYLQVHVNEQLRLNVEIYNSFSIDQLLISTDSIYILNIKNLLIITLNVFKHPLNDSKTMLI